MSSLQLERGVKKIARDPSPVNRARHSVQSRETKVRNREEKRLRFFEFVKIRVVVRVDTYKGTCEYERERAGERGTRSFPAELQSIGRRGKTGGVGRSGDVNLRSNLKRTIRTPIYAFSLLLSPFLALSLKTTSKPAREPFCGRRASSSSPSSRSSQKPSSPLSSPPPSPATAASSSRPTRPSVMIKVYGEEPTVAAADPLLSLPGFLLSGFQQLKQQKQQPEVAHEVF
ncbi:hypothetical protein RHMOL_Rhmol07G0166100 [Rhododendron molle]|uniref:Uncharacterized protein n=4 Tax=Rhododendron molle TaxID=49168 RepID=A0ACC0N1M4_RHOML|nr:hypothetical protein RHMOL_Rhmol07G0166100 [Rhododendron molle]KAI8547064.1 hypothetical protein RHMOL_Rhmol07G0166100 [Rhododendron molle]KAI8547065.1 hypothetical protein RHMOL_Rhmol07G0166100 [Rhododendron molle]KAI8547066.1 hypothetical protein RHMOL_Rhmol07G0166100 [Rhododendron molle]